MEKPKLRIENEGLFETKVFIDDKDITHLIKGVRFSHYGGDFAKIELDILNCDISIKNGFVPPLPEIFRPYYKLKTEEDFKNDDSLTE